MDVVLAGPVLIKLVRLGMSARDALRDPADNAVEPLSPIVELLELGRGLTERPAHLAARHLALVTRAFGEALRRHWGYTPPSLDARFEAVMARTVEVVARPGTS